MNTWTLKRERQITRAEWLRLERGLRDRAALADQRGTRRAVVEYVVCATIAYSGLRRRELAELDCGDVCLTNEAPYLVVRAGKGGKFREVVISPFLRRLLKRFIGKKEEWEEPTEPLSPLFVSQRGPFSGSGVARIFRNACARVGIRQLGVHVLRHFFASNLLRASRSLKLVQRQLGHSRLAVTEAYLHLETDELVEGMCAFERLIEKGLPTAVAAAPRRFRIAK